MKNTYLLLFIISLFYSCENETNSNQILSPDNISSQFFQIDITSDTIIQTQGGTILEIAKNTFASNSGSIKLEVKEVLTKADIIESGLFTVTEDKEILESDGMLYLNVEPKQEPLKDIKVKMPTKAVNPNMEVFELGEDNLWRNPQPLLETVESKRIALGQELYTKHCASCHNENLRENMTGPALGNVHLFRTEEWLRDFTLNSTKMISDLDSLSICLWSHWKPTAMTSFEGLLSEKEISDIYFFIENESSLQKIKENEVEYIVKCDITYKGDPDDPNSGDWKIDSIETLTNQGNRNKTHHGHSSGNSTEVVNLNLPNFTPFNIFWANNLGWTNIDCLLGRNDISSQKIKSFEVKLEGNIKDVQTNVLLILEKRNVVLGIYGLNSEGNFIFPKGYQLILPKEEARIIAINENYAYASKKIMIGDTNFHTLELKQKSEEEFSKLIKKI
jgi:mono/diheme cytochrome c family protein